MTLTNVDKAPFPWFGGKRRASPAVWAALGDVPHYVEPFGGTLAVLLTRPHPPNRPYHSETVNDLDGLLVNFWRSIQQSPEETAAHASWPVTEFDKHARSCRLLQWRDTEMPALLAGDPHAHDPEMAGWWAWCVSVQIGTWGKGGPWWPDDTGRLRKWKTLPLLDGTDGVPAPGVPVDLPHISDNGQGVNHAGIRDTTDDITMPELVRWFRHLAARLRHVRVLNGDWTRTLTTGAAHTINVRMGDGPCGVFLDPPYGDVGRASLYGRHETLTVAQDVRDWCLTHGDDPKWRIVYAGYDDEGAQLEAAGWTETEWFTDGFLTGGMGNVGGEHQQHRERLWASPHCLRPRTYDQPDMFGEPA